MKLRMFLGIISVLALTAPGCRQDGIIAEGDDFVLTVEQFRFEVTRLGPSASYEDTYEERYAVVLNLAARNFLADEAERRGHGGDELQSLIVNAEKAAVSDLYRRWKVDKMVMLPRIKTKPWIGKLDRKLHIKDLVFLVHPVAEEALGELREGLPISSMEEAAAERDDIRITDMGWMIWKDLPREVANVVFRLDAGGASDIVPAGDGYHVFYLVEDSPFGIGWEILSIRSKRFAGVIEEEKLARGLRKELSAKYNVRFLDAGLADGLKVFAISFAGERPPDSLMASVIATCPGAQVTVGDVYSTYFALPTANRPYLGDYHGLTDFSLQLIMPDLQALAGYEMGLGRSREVRFAARKAREDYLVPMMEDYYRSQVEITPRDILEYYEERKEDLAEPERYHTSRILVSSWESARQAHRQILMGADFADIAMQVSEDEPSAPHGGDLGWLNTGLVATYDSVLADMDPGDVSPPFKTYSGIEILKLEERVAPRILSLAEATPSVKMYITNTRANEMLAEFVAQRQKELGFTINEDLLREVWLPGPDYAPTRYQEEESTEEEESSPPLPKIG